MSIYNDFDAAAITVVFILWSVVVGLIGGLIGNEMTRATITGDQVCVWDEDIPKAITRLEDGAAFTFDPTDDHIVVGLCPERSQP